MRENKELDYLKKNKNKFIKPILMIIVVSFSFIVGLNNIERNVTIIVNSNFNVNIDDIYCYNSETNTTYVNMNVTDLYFIFMTFNDETYNSISEYNLTDYYNVNTSTYIYNSYRVIEFSNDSNYLMNDEATYLMKPHSILTAIGISLGKKDGYTIFFNSSEKIRNLYGINTITDVLSIQFYGFNVNNTNIECCDIKINGIRKVIYNGYFDYTIYNMIYGFA
jgi:hypothetical protein